MRAQTHTISPSFAFSQVRAKWIRGLENAGFSSTGLLGRNATPSSAAGGAGGPGGQNRCRGGSNTQVRVTQPTPLPGAAGAAALQPATAEGAAASTRIQASPLQMSTALEPATASTAQRAATGGCLTPPPAQTLLPGRNSCISATTLTPQAGSTACWPRASLRATIEQSSSGLVGNGAGQ